MRYGLRSTRNIIQVKSIAQKIRLIFFIMSVFGWGLGWGGVCLRVAGRKAKPEKELKFSRRGFYLSFIYCVLQGYQTCRHQKILLMSGSGQRRFSQYSQWKYSFDHFQRLRRRSCPNRQHKTNPSEAYLPLYGVP